MKKSTKNLLWLLLLIVLTVCTVLVITSCSKGFSFKGFMHLISNASPVWILFAALCAFGFVFFEGMGLKCTCDFLGEPITTGKAILFGNGYLFLGADPLGRRRTAGCAAHDDESRRFGCGVGDSAFIKPRDVHGVYNAHQHRVLYRLSRDAV